MGWIRRQISRGVNPRSVLASMLSPGSALPDNMDDVSMWMLLASFMSEPEPRSRLATVTTLNDVIRLIETSSKIIVLTGAGVSQF